MSHKLVIFDVDGTLVDSQVSILASMEFAFSKAGRVVPDREAALGIIGLSLSEAMAVLAPDASKTEQLQLAQDYKNGHREHREGGDAVARGPLFDGALDVIHALAESGYRLSAATGKSRAGLNRFLVAQGIDHLFHGTQSADDAPSKPHPQMVLNCLAAHGVAPKDAVMIGDTSFDVQMGLAAGCRAIGVRWGYHRDERVIAAGAERMARSFHDVQGMVAELIGTP